MWYIIKLIIGNSELNINVKIRRKVKCFFEIDFNVIIVKLLYLWEWVVGDLFVGIKGCFYILFYWKKKERMVYNVYVCIDLSGGVRVLLLCIDMRLV